MVFLGLLVVCANLACITIDNLCVSSKSLFKFSNRIVLLISFLLKIFNDSVEFFMLFFQFYFDIFQVFSPWESGAKNCDCAYNVEDFHFNCVVFYYWLNLKKFRVLLYSFKIHNSIWSDNLMNKTSKIKLINSYKKHF